MTLIVVDEHRMVADSYATITDEKGSYVMEDFPKLFALEKPIRLSDGTTTFKRVGFCGNARAFEEFLSIIRALEMTKDEFIDIRKLNVMDQFVGKDEFQVIFPIPNGAISITYGAGRLFEVRRHLAPTVCFGADYVKPIGAFGEYRPWFCIYLDAIFDKHLPGPDVHYMLHDHGDLIKDTVKSPEKKKRKERLFRFVNR